MTDISLAMDELAKMARFAKAFEGAKTILETLANSEQVSRELDAANAAKRDVLADLTVAAAEAETRRDGALTEARGIREGAKADAAAIEREAHEQAAEIIRAANGASRDRMAERDRLQADANDLAARIGPLRDELADVEHRLAQAKEAMKRALEG